MILSDIGALELADIRDRKPVTTCTLATRLWCFTTRRWSSGRGMMGCFCLALLPMLNLLPFRPEQRDEADPKKPSSVFQTIASFGIHRFFPFNTRVSFHIDYWLDSQGSHLKNQGGKFKLIIYVTSADLVLQIFAWQIVIQNRLARAFRKLPFLYQNEKNVFLKILLHKT